MGAILFKEKSKIVKNNRIGEEMTNRDPRQVIGAGVFSELAVWYASEQLQGRLETAVKTSVYDEASPFVYVHAIPELAILLYRTRSRVSTTTSPAWIFAGRIKPSVPASQMRFSERPH